MKDLEQLKSELQELVYKANKTINSIQENSSTDRRRKNIQRGKLIAYEYVLSLITERT